MSAPDEWGVIPPPDDLTPLPPEPPSIMGRIGQQFANAPSNIISDMLYLGFNLGIKEPGQEEPLSVPTPYQIPEAQGGGEFAVDLAAGLGRALVPFTAGAKIGRILGTTTGAGPVVSRMLSTGGGFATSGLTESPEEAAISGSLGAGMGVAEALLPSWGKAAAAAAVGLATRQHTLDRGGSEMRANIEGGINTLLPFAPNVIARLRNSRTVETPPVTVEPSTPLLPYGKRNLLEDMTSPKIIPGTGGPILYGGTLSESTTRARPIFGTERSATTAEGAVWPERFMRKTEPIEAEFTTPIRNVNGEAMPPLLPKRSTPPEGSLIREPSLTEGEVLRNYERTQQRPSPEIATLQPKVTPTLSKNRVRLSTVLSASDETMAQEAAKKLRLEYHGIQDIGNGQQFFELKIPENSKSPAAGANINVPVGATYRDLKNHLAFKTEQFTAKSGEELNAINKKWEKRRQSQRKKEDIVRAPKAEPVTTLQKQNPASFSFEKPPEGVALGDTIRFKFAGETLSGQIKAGVEPGTFRLVDKSGTPYDIPPRDLITTPKAKFEAKREGEIEQVGGMSGIEAAQSATEPGTIKLGSGTMRRSNFGEAGSISPEMLSFLGRYGITSAIGATVGAAEADEDSRLEGAITGAVVGGLAGHFGAKIFSALAKGHTKAATTGTTAGRIAAMGRNVQDDVINLAKAVTGNETMAARAASRWGLATEYERIARFIEKNVGVNPAVARFLDKSHGLVNDLSETMRTAIKGLTRIDGVSRHYPELNQYFEGKMLHADLMAKVPKEVADLAATAMQARTALQKIALDGLGPGKLSTTIQESIGKYLTTAYKVFHDPKYIPSDSQIQAAARSMFSDWGNFETRMDLLYEYLHEIKANKGLYRGGAGKGAALDVLLARKEILTPEFKAMLGEYKNPLERMAFTGVKLVNAGRSAEFFNEVARGTKTNGLKYSYTTAEREAEIATLQSLSRLGHSPIERAAAATKLKELQEYVWNADGVSSGRLSRTWLDRRMRDQLANYDSAVTGFTSPLMRAVINTTNMIKYGQIILSPLQFVRQVYSMPVLGIMAKTNPVDWLKAFRTLNDKSPEGLKELTRLKQLGVYGGDPVGGMFRKDMQNLMEGSLDKVINDRLRQGLHRWEEFWRQPDIMIRVSAFQRKEAELLERGVAREAATDKAIDHMNRYTMNYATVPPVVQKGRQLPFVNQYLSFSYEAMRIAKNLGEDAIKGDLHAIGALATVATLPFIIQQMAESALSPEDKKEWNKVKNLGRDYERHNFRFVQGRNPNGDFRYILFSPLVPHDPWLQSIRAIMAGDTSALAAANPVVGWENTPLLNVATTLVSGRNRFSGQKLHTVTDYANSVRKDVAPLLLGNDLDRIKRALTPNEEGGRGVIDTKTGKVSSISEILQTYATSIRPYTVRPEHLLRQAQAEAMDRIRSQQLTYRQILSTNASAEQKQRAKDNFDKAMTQILLSFKQKFGVDISGEE